MSELADESIQCCVTSPPYWGLRKYAGNQDLIWGDNHCEHKWGNEIPPPNAKSGKHQGELGNVNEAQDSVRFTGNLGAYCQLCNAWRGAYGLEPTPELYVQHTIEILREIRRALRKDGVCFWNVGDSYCSGKSRYSSKQQTISGKDRGDVFEGKPDQYYHQFLKDKDLCLIPFRVAISAQEDGWWVRSVIIWSKINPMPESVKDRPTESHEYILMLTKSARYYWDMEAVREPQQLVSLERMKRNHFTNYDPNYPNQPPQRLHQNDQPLTDEEAENLGGRNIRSVWEFPTHGYPEAHFATFPEKLPELCIKAASKEKDFVLDPFAGSGTTLWVAKKLNRRAVGYELSEEYCQLSLERNRQSVMNLEAL
jgi:DNA modification methylase